MTIRHYFWIEAFFTVVFLAEALLLAWQHDALMMVMSLSFGATNAYQALVDWLRWP